MSEHPHPKQWKGVWLLCNNVISTKERSIKNQGRSFHIGIIGLLFMRFYKIILFHMCSLDLFNICNYELPQGGDQLLQKIFPLLYLQYIGLHYMCVNSSLGLAFKPLPQNLSRQCPLNGYTQQSQVTITIIIAITLESYGKHCHILSHMLHVSLCPKWTPYCDSRSFYDRYA